MQGYSIDVTGLLYDMVTTVSMHHCYDINEASKEALIVGFAAESCNMDSVIAFSIPSSFTRMERLIIMDRNFRYVNSFDVSNFPSLQMVTIRTNSFTTVQNGYGDNPNRSFRMTNNTALATLAIGSYSFSDYGGGFVLSSTVDFVMLW